MLRRTCLVVLLVLFTVLSATADSRIEGTALETVIAEINARQEKIETLRADFRQEKSLALLANTEVSTGKFVFAKPNRVLWTYESPKTVTMLIADGWLTTYYPQLKKAEKLEVKRFEDRIFRYLGAASGALRELGRYFDFKFIDDRTKSSWVLVLEPKTQTVARRVKKLTVWIDRATYLTTRFEYLEGDGDLTRYEFSNIETNITLPVRQFALDLPKGVRVEQIRLNR